MKLIRWFLLTTGIVKYQFLVPFVHLDENDNPTSMETESVKWLAPAIGIYGFSQKEIDSKMKLMIYQLYPELDGVSLYAEYLDD